MELYKRLLLILTSGIMMVGLICLKIDAPSHSVSASESNKTQNTSGDGNTVPSSDGSGKLAENISPSALPDTFGDGSDIPGTSTGDVAAEPTEIPDGPTPTPEPNPLKPEVYPQIHTLIEDYFKAKLSCDLEQFKNIVTDVSYINIEAMARSTESVKDYTNLKVYTKRGYGPIDTVVYCTFDMIVPNVDSPIASIDSFYIVNDENGNPKIFSGVLEDNIVEKLLEMDNDEEVAALKTYVSTEIEHAMQKDPTLVEFWENMLNGIPESAITKALELPAE